MKKHVVLLLAAVCILAVSASAEESSSGGGFFDFIIGFFSDILNEVIGRVSSLFGGSKPIVCNPPYLRYGSGCCLDADDSGVCDRDERTTTTTLKTSTTKFSSTSTTEVVVTTEPTTSTRRTTTTTTTSTTTTSSTTTTLAIACNTSSDCGEQKEVRVCHNGDVYLKRLSPRCEKPGTPESYCSALESWVGASMMTKPVPVEGCAYGCQDGECLE